MDRSGSIAFAVALFAVLFVAIGLFAILGAALTPVLAPTQIPMPPGA